MMVSAFIALGSGISLPATDTGALIFSTPSSWIASPAASAWVNLLLLCAVAAVMIYINRVYTIPRSITLVYAVVFCVAMTATPSLTAALSAGALLAATVACCWALMLGAFASHRAPQRVLTVFFILSAGATVHYAFALYIPVFLIGCAQMRVFSLRTVLAALMGIAAPWWLIFGLGIASPSQLRVAETLVAAVQGVRPAGTMLATALFTAFIMVASYAATVLKLLTYNARTRAGNGLITLTALVTMLLMAVDSQAMAVYMPLLNCCAAIFLSHLFVIRDNSRAWVLFMFVTIIYYAFYSWIVFV